MITDGQKSGGYRGVTHFSVTFPTRDLPPENSTS